MECHSSNRNAEGKGSSTCAGDSEEKLTWTEAPRHGFMTSITAWHGMSGDKPFQTNGHHFPCYGAWLRKLVNDLSASRTLKGRE